MQDCQCLCFVVFYEGEEELASAEMTAVPVQQPPMAGDAGLHCDENNLVDSDNVEEFEDVYGSNCAKLLERYHIQALAGMF